MKNRRTWIAYSKKPPFLPIAVASTAQELANLVGVKKATVESGWSKYKNGEAKYSRYYCLEIEEDE